jgi:AcrR family transcriptional regulator
MTRAERRERLLDAALDLLAERGFEALSIQTIAQRAGVNRALVYRNFANLQLLLLALHRREDLRTRETIDALLPDDPTGHTIPELLASALATLLSGVLRHPQAYRLVLQRPESAPVFMQKMVNRRRALIAERLQPLIGLGVQRTAAPAEALDVGLASRLLLSAGEELARLALDDPEFPPERVLRSTWTLLDTVRF